MAEYVKPFKINRFTTVIALFAFWAFVIAARLIHYPVILHEELSGKTVNVITKNILPHRGTISDSHMNALATSMTVKNVIAEPGNMPNIFIAAEQLSPLLGVDRYALINRMADPARSKYLLVKKKINPNLAPDIKALNIEGLRFEDDSLRAYANRNLMDRSIQRLTERELEFGVRQSHATAGTVDVMELETGRILAPANYPNFNCNQYGKYSRTEWRNRAVQDQCEPGSTLKVVVASFSRAWRLLEFC